MKYPQYTVKVSAYAQGASDMVSFTQVAFPTSAGIEYCVEYMLDTLKGEGAAYEAKCADIDSSNVVTVSVSVYDDSEEFERVFTIIAPVDTTQPGWFASAVERHAASLIQEVRDNPIERMNDND